MNIKQFSLFLLLSVSLNYMAFSQTKKVKINDNYSLEEFYVLKSNQDIKQGEYKKYIKFNNPNKTGKVLVEEGAFNNNQKNGVWRYYNTNTSLNSTGLFLNDKKDSIWQFFEKGVLVMKGEFENGIKVGNWNYFNSKTGNMNKGQYIDGDKVGKWTYMYQNQVSQIYNYNLDSAIYTIKDTLNYFILQKNDTIIDKMDRVPQYIGYKFNLNRDMTALTKYPSPARRMGYEGEVLITFVINENGNLSDFKVLKNIMPGLECANEVIRAFKESNKKWISGIYHGSLVKTIYIQSIVFELVDEIEENTGFGITRITYN